MTLKAATIRFSFLPPDVRALASAIGRPPSHGPKAWLTGKPSAASPILLSTSTSASVAAASKRRKGLQHRRDTRQAMGRLGVAIGGLVPMTLQTGQMATAQIGDYVYLGSNQSNCTVSGAPKGLELTALITEPPETSGRPKCQRQDTDTGKDDYVKGSAIGRIFQFGPGTDEVQVLLC